jgi:hypothetical protein
MFGVGCSFSDNETERALREEITNQACRGWFSAGQLAEVASAPGNKTSQDNSMGDMTTMTMRAGEDASIQLSEDDDMFELETKSYQAQGSNNCNSNNSSSGSSESHKPRKSLIDHMIPRNYGK